MTTTVFGLSSKPSPLLTAAGLRDALDGVQSDADYFAKHDLRYRERNVGLWGKVNDILGIDWDDPQRVVCLIDEMDAGDG
jgi:hypothetical protein